jgi:hypothetical protein
MNTGSTSDAVIDLIMSVESRRQRIEKDSGLAASCDEALRKLHEFLDHEREALQAHGPGARHQANIETVAIEIARVKKLLGNTRRDASAAVPRPGHVSLQSGSRSFLRDKGRRTMGRGER